jgi:hypothetical protein
LIESPKDLKVVIERKGVISHGAILHGCVIREGATVGIGAIVLDGAEGGTEEEQKDVIDQEILGSPAYPSPPRRSFDI